jgi:hypothetical protein
MSRTIGFSGTRWAVLAAAAAFGVAAGGNVSAGGKPPADVKVTVDIADFVVDSLGNNVDLRIGSDRLGSYPGTDANVTSQITPNSLGSFWSLTTYYSSKGALKASTRRVWFDLTEPAAPGQPAPPLSTGYSQASLIANCYQDGVDLLTMGQGSVAQCRGLFRFQAPDGKWYRLAFQPQNYPETDKMQVTCTLSSGSGATTACSRWTVSPNTVSPRVTTPDGTPKSLVRLVEIDAGGAVVNPDLGDYYVSFSIKIARQ